MGRIFFSSPFLHPKYLKPKLNDFLVFYDKKTHKPLAKISLDNAKQKLDVNFDKKRKKTTKK